MDARNRRLARPLALAAALLLGTAAAASAAINGVPGPAITLVARDGYILTPDANSIYMWGFALENLQAAPPVVGAMQYPGPTLVLEEGVPVTVRLKNKLTVPVSIVFPGQGAVGAAGGVPGLVTREAPPGGTVTYTFTPAEPGTYVYQSGTRSDLQIEMGLVGAIVVRPAGYVAGFGGQAYAHADSQYDHEYLFLLSEIDPVVHQAVEAGRLDTVDTAAFFPVYWMINGRAAPDTMLADNVAWLPNQPYGCMPQGHPGEKILMRMVGAGRDPHPYHTHGNHHTVIARNGRMLTAAAGADLAEDAFTSTVFPGETVDALYSWTGEGLGWDLYGHVNPADPARVGQLCVDDGVALEPNESLADHCKAFPVVLPSQQALTFGPWYGGSPFLGTSTPLPPGQGQLNPNAGFFFMFHSHNEKEITNNDIFPGGMLTMVDIEPPGAMLMNP